ncbi:MAG: hypothetical protein ACRENS_08855 [Candidatus Eiseniibacteriota bacterium]
MHAREFSFNGEGRTSWAKKAEHPSALDYLLSALATDLLSGLVRESHRGGPAVREAELRLEAWLENPMIVAGIVNEAGSPRIKKIRGTLYLGTEGAESEVRAMWQRVFDSSPVHASLAPGVDVRINFKLIA